MRWFHNLSIRNKLMGIILLVTILALGIGFTLVIINDIQSFQEDMMSHTSVTAQVIGDYCVGPLLFGDKAGAEKILAKLAAVPSIVNALVYDTEGNQFASLSDSIEGAITSQDLRNRSSQFINEYLHIFQPINYNEVYYGTIYLQASTQLLNVKIKEYLRYMVLLGTGLIILSIVLAVWLQRFISKPILNLANVAGQIAVEENYSIRVEKKGYDETGLLYDGFNNMLEQIQTREIERDRAEETLRKNNEQLQREITERKRAEEELNRYFSLSLDMFCIAGTDGFYKRVNPAFEHTVGYTAEELMAQPLVNFVHPDDHEATIAEVEKLSAGLDTISFENRFRCKDGSYKWLMWNATCIPSQDLIYGAARDVTERKRSEEELAKHREHLEELVETRTIELTNANKQLQQEIEERKRAEEMVRANEETYRIVIEQTGQMVYDYDITTGRIKWLGDIEGITGYTSEEFLEVDITAWEKLIHPDDRPQTLKILDDTMKKGAVFNVEYRLKSKAGPYLDTKDNGVFLKDKKGHAYRLLGTMKDITEHKRIEEARRENEEKFQAISASAQDAIIIMDNDGKIAYWNEAAIKIFGYTRKEALGQELHVFLAPERYHEAYKRGFNRFQKTGKGNVIGTTIELVGIKKDGTEFPFELSLSSVKIKNKWNAIGILRDITERKEAEEKLKLYRRIFLNTNDGIIIMDSDGILLERNPAHQYLSSYTDEDVLGKTVAPFMGNETYQDFIHKLKENKVYRGEFVAHRKDGSPINIDLSAFSIEYDEGDPICYVGMSRDITERKKAEEALATRLRYEEGLAACSRTLLTGTETKNAINEALFFLLKAADTSRVYIFENFEDEVDGLCMRQTHEVCAEGVVPQIDDPLLQHAPYKMGFDRWREILSKGEPIKGLPETFPSSEQEILVPQGNLSMLVIPITIDGNWFGFIGFDDVWEKREWSNEDISALQTASEMIGIYIERKRFEEMIRVSEERFRSLVENANDIIYSLTPQGEFSYISPKFTDIMGYAVSEYIGKSLFPLIHPDDAKEATKWYRSKIKDGQRQRDFEFRFLHKDGSLRWIVGNSSVILDEDGKIFEVIGVAHDFTEMKKILEDLEHVNQHLRETQAQLVQSAKMASLGQLVAGIAHEINTPIGAVNSMQDTLFRTVENIKEVIKTQIPKKYGEQHKFKAALKIMDDSKHVIQSGTERVINIVRRLRSFARLDEAELKTVDIHEGLEDTLTLIYHEIKHHITVKRDYGKIPEIACFPGKLNQVFLNILVNAKQAIKRKGRITIFTRSKDDKVMIAIKDNGVGISKKHLKKVFDPGFTTKGVGVGTGLGLSICYQIIQDHRGEIKVESALGKGTTFTIVLPLALDKILEKENT